jgi:hypothetical protein
MKKWILTGSLIILVIGGIALATVAGAARTPGTQPTLVSPAQKVALMQQRLAAQRAAVAGPLQPAPHPGYLPMPSVPHLQTGIFPMSDGAPAALPARLFQLTDRAQLQSGNIFTIVYAGALASNLQQGVLVVFQENLVTGAESQHEYLAPRADGALTLTAIAGKVLSFSTPASHGTFNLATGQFQYQE